LFKRFLVPAKPLQLHILRAWLTAFVVRVLRGSTPGLRTRRRVRVVMVMARIEQNAL